MKYRFKLIGLSVKIGYIIIYSFLITIRSSCPYIGTHYSYINVYKYILYNMHRKSHDMAAMVTMEGCR